MKKNGPNPVDISGKRYGRLTAIRFSHRNANRRPCWIFKCDCGKEIVRLKINATRHNRSFKSCGCYTVEFAYNLMKNLATPVPEGTTGIKYIMHQYRQNAVAKNREFLLTPSEFENITRLNCYYCGIEPSNLFKKKGRIPEMHYSGIDRLNNNGGYTLENCVPCCRQCNWAKGKKNSQEFNTYIDRLVKYSLERSNK